MFWVMGTSLSVGESNEEMRLILCVAALLGCGCSARKPAEVWRVVKAEPEYVLRSPGEDIAFSYVLKRFNGFVLGEGWVDFREDMGLQVQYAMYEQGAERKGLKGFLGTETQRYLWRRGRWRRLKGPKEGEALSPVERLRGNFQRFFYAVKVNRVGSTHSSALLTGDSQAEIERLSKALAAAPQEFCQSNAKSCLLFPDLCTAAPLIGVLVNGKREMVPWGTGLGGVVGRDKRLLEFLRWERGGMRRIEVDGADSWAMRLPLLPGDVVRSE